MQILSLDHSYWSRPGSSVYAKLIAYGFGKCPMPSPMPSTMPSTMFAAFLAQHTRNVQKKDRNTHIHVFQIKGDQGQLGNRHQPVQHGRSFLILCQSAAFSSFYTYNTERFGLHYIIPQDWTKHNSIKTYDSTEPTYDATQPQYPLIMKLITEIDYTTLKTCLTLVVKQNMQDIKWIA